MPLLFAVTSGLSVETDTPDALCPPLDEVRRAVSSRLGSIELGGEWKARYSRAHREAGDFVILELRDPENAVRLTREFPGGEQSCTALAGVIALVLDRYFQRLEDPTAAAMMLEGEEPAGAKAEPASSKEAGTAERASASHAFEAGVSVSSWFSGPTLGYVLHVPGGPSLFDYVALELSASAGRDSETVGDGRARVFRGRASLSFGPRFALGERFSLRVGPAFGGTLEDADTTGLVDDGGGTRFVPFLGAELTLTATLAGPLGVFAGGSGHYNARFAAPDFEVDDRTVLEPPALVGAGKLGISLTF